MATPNTSSSSLNGNEMASALDKTMTKIDPEKLASILTSSSSSSTATKRKQPSAERRTSSNDHHGKQSKRDDHDAHNTINQYQGWTVPEPQYILPTIDATTVTPTQFYNEYVSPRRPVVLRGTLHDLQPVLTQWSSSRNNNDHFRQMAGKELLSVEQRSHLQESFGRGQEVSMTFAEFLDLVEQGDSYHYLTTQNVYANDDGRPDLMAPFLKCLAQDFPYRPHLMGHLVPQNINIWMGNNQDGTSSGLHHDYHDNLYMVIRGTKKFRLYSPQDTEKMYTKGKLVKVHPNGRINYEGEITTAYGADLQSDAAAKASKAKEIAEQKLIKAEQDVALGKPGAEEDLERAEEMLEEAMDALLDAEMGDDDDDDDDMDGSDIDDEAIENDDEHDKNMESIDELSSSSRRVVDKTVKNPNNFSQVPLDLLKTDNKEQLKQKFPEILKANVAFCEVSKGDILYLPASWFHEVTSFGGKDGHLALNYWFHPPDAVNNFDNPYTTDFWPNDYQDRFEN